MTPAQIAKIMALVEEYAIERFHGGPEVIAKARAAVEAALRDAPQQAEGRIHTLVTGCDDCPSCVYSSAGRYSCERADYRKFDADGKSSVPPEWCPLPPSAPTAVEPDERTFQNGDILKIDGSGAPCLYRAGQLVPVETDDPLLGEALRLCVEKGYTSISFVQRRLNIGYQRAGELVATINKRGLFDAARASKGTPL